jgi:hypothetical protein
MDPSIFGVVVKVVLFYDPGWEQAQGHFHVFEIFKGSSEIKVFNIKALVPSVWCAHDTVPM